MIDVGQLVLAQG